MKSVVNGLVLTSKSLLDHKMWGIFLLTGLVNTAVWVGLVSGVWYLIHDHSSIQVEWMKNAVEAASVGVSILIAFLLFPLTFPLVITLFEERISIYTERHYYGSISSHSIMTMKERIIAGLRFFAVMALLNLILIPFYFIPVLNFIIYYTVNGYLLGREFFEMVVSRHETLEDMRALRRKYRWQLISGGAALVFCATIPFLNLVIPALSVIFIVHFYHNMR